VRQAGFTGRFFPTLPKLAPTEVFEVHLEPSRPYRFQDGAQSSSRPWTAALLTTLILVGMLLITAWSRGQSHASDLRAASAEARQVARQLAEHTAQLLARIDHATALATAAAQLPPAHALLIDGERHSAVVVLGSDGKVQDSTVLARGTDLSTSRLFQLARSARGNALALGAPMRLTTNGPALVPTVRVLRDASGAFAGALVVAINMDYFTQAQYLPKHPKALFALTDEAGQVVAGQVQKKSMALVQLPAPEWQRLRKASPEGTDLPLMQGPRDHCERLVAVVPVGAYGLHALVGIPLASATLDARELFKVVYAVVALLGLGIVAVSVGIQRQHRRLRSALDTRSSAEEALREEKEFLDVTLDSIDDAVVTLDQHLRITFINRRAEVLTGCPGAEALGRPLQDVVHLMAGDANSDVQLVPSLQARSQGTAHLASRTGSRVAVEYVVTPLTQRHSATHSVLVMHDVSKASLMAHKLAYQASHDPLTGLFNRAAFDANLDSVLSSLEDAPLRSHVLLFLDLDQFKVVNDSCGHAAGDELLKQVAFLFGQTLRQGDVLARTGGDEFAVLLQNCPARVALTLADKLRHQLMEFRFVWQEKSFQVGVSIGAVAFTGRGNSRDELMRKADTACYIAKDGGRNRAHLYLDCDEAVMARQGELSWATRLQKALAHGEFVLQGQPIVATCGERRGHYYELLVRLVEADGRLVPPMAFLPAAERYGLMPALDRAVIERALAMHAELQAATAEPLKFAINLSGASLSDPQLLEFIRAALLRHQVAAGSICFEVTETVAIANLQVAVKLMSGLKSLGCGLSLDDFGSGMSSFSYLKQLPVDVVKIDGSFVRNMLANPVDYAMVEAVNNIAHQMGLQTLAEYAESPELIDALSRMGVDMLQGYGVGQPQTLAQMHAALRQDRLS
jgi:diguanylate cyclase (GGDEF)-like protein/PAS domain S-box-containing protein